MFLWSIQSLWLQFLLFFAPYDELQWSKHATFCKGKYCFYSRRKLHSIKLYCLHSATIKLLIQHATQETNAKLFVLSWYSVSKHKIMWRHIYIISIIHGRQAAGWWCVNSNRYIYALNLIWSPKGKTLTLLVSLCSLHSWSIDL